MKPKILKYFVIENYEKQICDVVTSASLFNTLSNKN